VVREIWFIITLVTHSSGVSRGIHHKCKHPLNPTKLYVSGWVESSRSVLIESHNMLGWCLDIEWWETYLDCMIKMLLALAYPVYVWLSCMWFFFLAMIINLIDGSRWARFQRSARKWRFRRIVRVGLFIFSLWVHLGLRPTK